MAESWTTCKADRRKVQIWFALTIAVCLATTCLFAWIEPKSLSLLCVSFASLIAICGAVLLRARFRYNEEQIQCRYFRSFNRNWRDANGWSYSSAAGRLSLYIRFDDGVVVGSTPWLLDRSEIIELIPLLMEKLGEPERDQRKILPWPYSVVTAKPSS